MPVRIGSPVHGRDGELGARGRDDIREMDLIEREKGESKAFRLKNFVDVLRTLKVLCAVEGAAASSPAVYGCRGSANRRWVSAYSTIRPAYITAVRVAI